MIFCHAQSYFRTKPSCLLLGLTLLWPVEPAGPDGDSAGGRKSHPPRQHGAGEPGGGADLSASVENPQRLRPAERPGPARLPAAGTNTHARAPQTQQFKRTQYPELNDIKHESVLGNNGAFPRASREPADLHRVSYSF